MAKKPQSRDRTLQELVAALRDPYEQEGKSFRRLEYPLRRVLEVYPDLRESQVTEQHFADYGPKRIKLAAAKGRKLSERTIQNEQNSFRRLFTFQSARQGCSSAGAAKRAGVDWNTLNRLVKTGFFKPSIQPKGGARGPRTGRWSDVDIEAVKKYKALREKGATKQALERVGSNLCEHRPDLAKDGAYNEAFSRTKLVVRHGDVCERTPDGGYISWLHQPGQELPRNEETVAGFGERFFLSNLKKSVSEKSFKNYVRQLRKHIYPFFGHLPFAEIHQHVRDFGKAKSAEGISPETIEDCLGLLGRLLEHAKRKGRYHGPALSKSVPGLRKRQSEHPALASEDLRKFVAALCEKGEKRWALWLLLRAVLGLRTREACALKWSHVGEQDIAIRLSCYGGRVRSISDREMRDLPLPEALASLFREYRKEARFSSENDFVFANSTGKKPFDPHNIYARHLQPAADDLGISRNSLYKLERTTVLLTAQAGLTSAQQDSVLRLRPGTER